MVCVWKCMRTCSPEHAHVEVYVRACSTEECACGSVCTRTRLASAGLCAFLSVFLSIGISLLVYVSVSARLSVRVCGKLTASPPSSPSTSPTWERFQKKAFALSAEKEIKSDLYELALFLCIVASTSNIRIAIARICWSRKARC